MEKEFLEEKEEEKSNEEERKREGNEEKVKKWKVKKESKYTINWGKKNWQNIPSIFLLVGRERGWKKSEGEALYFL